MINANTTLSAPDDSSSHSRDVVLVVDDNPANLELLFQYLDRARFQVRVANSGQNALKQIDVAKPDLILLDVVMPGLDGFETCHRLKAEEKTRDIPVIFMTGLTDTTYKQKGFDLGAVDYVTKPLQYHETVARVSVHLAVRRLQQRLRTANSQLEAERAKQKQMAAPSQSRPLIDELQQHLESVAALTSDLSGDVDRTASDRIREALDMITSHSRQAISIVEDLRLS